MTYQDESLDRGLIASMALHIALFGILVLSPRIFPNFGANWGSQSGGTTAGTISAKIASNVSGVPLPTPEVVQKDAPANESPAFYKSEPAPAPAPDKTAEPVPQPKAPIKTTPVPKPKPAAPASKAPAPTAPVNAVPAGQGGRPDLAYGQVSTGAGQIGYGFGDASFGDRYGWYVTSITRAISNNWLKSLVSTNVQRAPRVYLSFTIARDGTVNCGDVSVKQSSGIPSLDRSAQRAVCASSPLPKLPDDYRAGSVSVNFYFEYSR